MNGMHILTTVNCIVNMPECVYNCNFYIIVSFFMTKAANLGKTRNAYSG